MILEQGIQRVQSLYSKGLQSDDSRLTPRHIYSALVSARSILYRQRVAKNQAISDWAYQILPCVELQKAAVHECPCVPNNHCNVLRTKYKLPKPITGLDSMLIHSVVSLDGSTVFDPTTFEDQKYELGNKFTSKKSKYYIRNGYLFLTTTKSLKALTIKLLANDPLEAKSFPSICGVCEGCECEDIMLFDFPIDGDLERPFLQLANEELISLFSQMKEDKNNNASDDTDKSGAMIHQPSQPEE